MGPLLELRGACDGALGVHGDWGRIGVEGVGILLEMEGSVGTGGVGGYWRGRWVLVGSVGTGGG